MNYKEWSAHDVEIMNDVLRLIRENGGSMLEEAVVESMHRFYENKYQERYRENTIVFTKKLDDIYIDMIRRGWIYREGKSLYIEDRGRVVEESSARRQLKSDRDRTKISIEWTEDEGKRKRTIFFLKVLGYIVLAVILILMIAGYISEDSPVGLLLKYLK